MARRNGQRAVVWAAAGLWWLGAAAGVAAEPDPLALYEELRAFRLGTEAVRVENFQFQRDRLEMSFTGQFLFAEPVAGRVTGAVFEGEGGLRVEPWSPFEQENIRRFLGSDVIEVTFETAVLRFTDETAEIIRSAGTPTDYRQRERALELAREFEGRQVRKTGMNLSQRLALSILHGEEPGVFFAEFDGGSHDNVCGLVDHQGRAPAQVFAINAGEKGLVYQYGESPWGYDVWTAFYSQQDLARRRVDYSDVFNLVKIPEQRFEIDLREPEEWVRMVVEIDLVGLRDGLRLIPMALNEGLGERGESRRKHGFRILEAELTDGTPVGVIQDEWQAGFSLVLPEALDRDEQATVRLRMEAHDYLWDWQGMFYYLRSNSSWYPRHGYLERSRFHLRFRHKKEHRVVATGKRLREGPVEDGSEVWLTEWRMEQPVALAAFAVGKFEKHVEEREIRGQKVTVEFDSVHYTLVNIKEDFMLAEMGNAIDFYGAFFGEYPYGRLQAVFFPARFGQGFATLLFLPAQGHARTNEFAFIAHEVAHQWWGNIVGWRSYRDQWLSEGFAEYSAVLYTAERQEKKKETLLVKRLREDLVRFAWAENVLTDMKLYEVGPIVLGHRLSSRASQGAYQALIYSKGALVMRMLEFLLRAPGSTDARPFVEMMHDFVERHRGGLATTESFIAVANQHFARSPLARKYRLRDLNWFFRQWVYQAAMPSYRLEYRIEPQGDGSVVVAGTLYQQGVPEDWFMVLPLVFEFSGDRFAYGTVPAHGPETPVNIRLPEKPKKVRLDPDMWVLSATTKTKKIK